MEREHLGRSDDGMAAAAGGRTRLTREYAKYKYRLQDFTVRMWCAYEGLQRTHKFRRSKSLKFESPRLESTEMTDDPSPAGVPASVPERKPLTPAATRALAEAEARRQAAGAHPHPPAAREFQGPKGPEPTRYGDWENKGIASDF
jgi:hypothetical protein